MERVLLLAHTKVDGSLGKAALEALSAAVELAGGGGSLEVGLVGGAAGADALAGCGAVRVRAVTGPEFAVSRYGSDAEALAALVQAGEPTLIVAAGSSRFSRVMPGVAQRLGGRLDTQITGISIGDGGPQVQRWYYRQRMVATLSRTTRPWFLLVAAGTFPAWQATGTAPAVEPLAVTLTPGAVRTQVQGVESASTGAETIRPDAALLFVAGAGWTKKQGDGQTHPREAEELIRGFLDRTQASLGSSKSLVDQGSEGEAVLSFLSHLNQVGQTGATPRHPRGLSTCCHGEEPHVVGWRFINERRAINLDPNCGWARGKADVLYVADAFAVIRRVNELLSQG